MVVVLCLGLWVYEVIMTVIIRKTMEIVLNGFETCSGVVV